MAGSSEHRAYRAGVVTAIMASFIIVWTTVVRDDGTGIAFFMVILAAAVGAFSAWFRPSGMARTMIGVGVMQLLLGVAFATAPSTAIIPGDQMKELLFNAVFTMLWLVSAAFFRAASQQDREAAAAH